MKSDEEISDIIVRKVVIGEQIETVDCVRSLFTFVFISIFPSNITIKKLSNSCCTENVKT